MIEYSKTMGSIQLHFTCKTIFPKVPAKAIVMCGSKPLVRAVAPGNEFKIVTENTGKMKSRVVRHRTLIITGGKWANVSAFKIYIRGPRYYIHQLTMDDTNVHPWCPIIKGGWKKHSTLNREQCLDLVRRMGVDQAVVVELENLGAKN